MLSGVASLLFGTSAPEPEQEVQNVDVPTRDAELDWVLVDLPNSGKSNEAGDLTRQQQQHEGESTLAPSPSPYQCELRVPVEIPEGDMSCPSDPESTGSSHTPSSPGCLCVALPLNSSSNPLTSLSCDRNILRVESWVLTPPPCFTGRRKRNSGVEESPMENLLIEHPSMSVYNSYGGDSTGEHSNESSSDVEMEESAVAHRTRQHVHHAPRRPHAVAARAGIVAHIQSVKYAQRKQQSKNSKHMGKKTIDRSNKAREYASAGKSQNNRVLRPSGRMSGRMSQRKF